MVRRAAPVRLVVSSLPVWAALVGSALPAHALLPRAAGTAPAPGQDTLDALDDLVAMPAAALPRGVRTHVDVSGSPAAVGADAARAWAGFVAQRGGGWQASWDLATGVPTRIWGPGIATPGVMASAARAADAAWAALSANLALLAPGASASDFVLVSNVSDGDLRTVGFVQQHAGLRVVGGQVSFRFKRDRLFVMSSQALPHVAPSWPAARARPDAVRTAMTRAFAALGGTVEQVAALPATLPAGAEFGPASDLVILPLVDAGGVRSYRVAAPLQVQVAGHGTFTVWADPATGAPIARRADRRYASGVVAASVVDRNPSRPRLVRPMPQLDLVVDGAAQRTGTAGEVTWPGAGAASATLSVAGALATVVNSAGSDATTTLGIPAGDTAVWDPSGDPLVDAQVSAYVHENIVKNYIRTFAPDLPTLDTPLTTNVNIDDQCNAFFSGTTINFFLASDACENTARLSDVVYHETGHWLHANAIIEGVGAFDGAMSEGLSDFLAASITEDPGMGRGFFFNEEPLRELDPPDRESMWPRDVGEIHHTGKIFGGTFWDLRKALIEQYGHALGVQLMNRLFLAAVQRATDIPSSLVEVLAADDDDGDLSNGTPNECTIRAAFGAHGMRTAYGALTAPGAVATTATQTSTAIRLDVRGASPSCPGEQVAGVEVRWVPGIGTAPDSDEVQATRVVGADGEYWTAQLPLPTEYGRVDYQATITFADGGQLVFPDNAADSYYQLSRGDMVPLYCTSFDDDPFGDHWTQGTTEGGTPWRWGTSPGTPGHPPTAHTGDAFLQMDTTSTYEPDALSWAALPRLDVGAFTDVRLQYRRWLSVEDGHFDHAAIRVNGALAWSNFDSDQGDASSVHHIDREWRYSEVRLSTRAPGPLMDIRFELESDPGLQLAGWGIDDLCVVANPTSICGDGTRAPTEACDDGAANGLTPDGCRANCQRASCGDGVVDTGEACDPGDASDPSCTAACTLTDDGTDGGCQAGHGGAGGAVLLGVLVAGGLRRRRRR